MVLTLQKLVHVHPDSDGSDSESDHGDANGRPRTRKRGGLMKRAKKMLFGAHMTSSFAEKHRKVVPITNAPGDEYMRGHTEGEPNAPMQKIRTLQRHRGGPNQERMAFMEAHSPLKKKSLAVSAEQVSIFLTSGKLNHAVLPEFICTNKR
jgi:hypothetical protein